MVVKIPVAPPGIVDVIMMLGFALTNKGRAIANGPWLSAHADAEGNVILSPALAKEVFELARTYRYFFRVHQASPATLPGLTMAEWTHLKKEAEELCLQLDVIKPER